MRYTIKINKNKYKKIPLKVKITFYLCIAIFIIVFLSLLLSMGYSFNGSREIQIDIDKVLLVDSHNTRGTRMKLELISGGQKYYLWYPPRYFSQYKESLHSDLLSGSVSSVIVDVPENQSIQDKMWNRKRIVGLRSESNVYYDIENAKEELKMDRISSFVGILFLTFVFILGCIFLMLAYGLVTVVSPK